MQRHDTKLGSTHAAASSLHRKYTNVLSAISEVVHLEVVHLGRGGERGGTFGSVSFGVVHLGRGVNRTTEANLLASNKKSLDLDPRFAAKKQDWEPHGAPARAIRSILKKAGLEVSAGFPRSDQKGTFGAGGGWA